MELGGLPGGCYWTFEFGTTPYELSSSVDFAVEVLFLGL
jgi:hypothetical protein